jgi:hypothetical protein
VVQRGGHQLNNHALSAINDISEEYFESALESFNTTIDKVNHKKRELARRGQTKLPNHQEEDKGSDRGGMGKHGDRKLKPRDRSVSSSSVPVKDNPGRKYAMDCNQYH